jgi:hypothetical protein
LLKRRFHPEALPFLSENRLNLKRGFVILFLLSLLVPPGATWLYLQCRKQQVKANVKAQLLAGAELPELVELKFALKDIHNRKLLRWEHDGEFEYRRQMYDIVEQCIEGDSIRYLCYWDKLETKLNFQLDRLSALALGHAPDARDTLGKFIFILKSLYCARLPVWGTGLELSWTRLFIYRACLDTGASAPPSPPPEI